MHKIWNKENLLQVIPTATSYIDAIRKLGLKATSNIKTLKKYLKLYDIPYSNLLHIPKPPTSFVKIDLNIIFVENSTISEATVRRAILRHNIISYRCSICDNNGTYLGMPLSLHLDHIDGINFNNKLENLRFLCPNCHSQTATYGAKNIKNRSYHKRTRSEYLHSVSKKFNAHDSP